MSPWYQSCCTQASWHCSTEAGRASLLKVISHSSGQVAHSATLETHKLNVPLHLLLCARREELRWFQCVLAAAFSCTALL